MKKLPRQQKIVIRFKGGLGNQIYQLAAGLMISRKTGARIYSSDIYYRYKENPREKVIESLYDGAISRERERLIQLLFSNASIRSLGSKSLPEYLGLGKMVVSDIIFLDWIRGGCIRSAWPGKTLVLDGYFQNAHSVENSGILDNLSALSPPCRHEIGIHIRLGDYLRAPYNSLYQIVNEDFIRKSYDHLVVQCGACPSAKLRVFSDSMEEALALVTRALPSVECVEAGGRSTVSDLRELAGHRNLILSNSSYSLLAWHMSKAANAVVPSSWFKSAETPMELFSQSPRLKLLQIQAT